VCFDVRCCELLLLLLSTAQGPGTPTAMTPSSEDTPFGFGSTPTVTGSVAAFKRRCEWFYVDPNGEEHGPVAFQKLMSWYKKGHFPEDVKVGSGRCFECAPVPRGGGYGSCHNRGYVL
jgi:hypothetical protein